MAVPTTPTATDKLEEVRKLNLEIADLTRVKDLAKGVAERAEEAVTEATARAKEADEHLKTLEATMAGSAAEIREFVAHCRNVMQTALSSMELLAQHAKDMQTKVDGLIEQITATQKTLDTLRESIAKENTSISEKRDDLDIYHQRILTAAESVGIKVKL